MPRPIQIAMAYDPDTETLHRMLLCSDGSMWNWLHNGKAWGWQRMPDIATEAAAPDTDCPSDRPWRQSPEVWR